MLILLLIKSVYYYFSNPLHTLRKLQYIVKIGDNRYWSIIGSLRYWIPSIPTYHLNF